MDDDYTVANRIRQQEVDYWKIKNEKYFEELEDADTRIRRLEARVIELEDQLEDSRDYNDRRNRKRARYGGHRGFGSGAGSSALSTPTSGPSIPVSQTPTTYAGTLSAPPRVNVQEDVVMEEGETAAFPPLPYPSQPVTHRSFGCANPRESDMQIRKSLKGDDYFKRYRPLTAIVENHGECAIPFGNPRDPAHSNL